MSWLGVPVNWDPAAFRDRPSRASPGRRILKIPAQPTTREANISSSLNHKSNSPSALLPPKELW